MTTLREAAQQFVTDYYETGDMGDMKQYARAALAKPQEPNAGSVLFAVEEAIRNGDCPWQIEAAFDSYEEERQRSLTK